MLYLPEHVGKVIPFYRKDGNPDSGHAHPWSCLPVIALGTLHHMEAPRIRKKPLNGLGIGNNKPVILPPLSFSFSSILFEPQ